ncbi:MAG: hypothetical protein GY719_21290 [bacterium]|nr:hypothetical protein [bacterium]
MRRDQEVDHSTDFAKGAGATLEGVAPAPVASDGRFGLRGRLTAGVGIRLGVRFRDRRGHRSGLGRRIGIASFGVVRATFRRERTRMSEKQLDAAIRRVRRGAERWRAGLW